jgi:hypothetical protein
MQAMRLKQMAITNKAKRYAQRGRAGAFGPAATFGVAVMLAFGAFVLATLTFPRDLALAAISSTFFAFAAFVALIAWRLDQTDNKALSYWDVAGALTLFGICAATLMDSDQFVRLVASQHD